MRFKDVFTVAALLALLSSGAWVNADGPARVTRASIDSAAGDYGEVTIAGENLPMRPIVALGGTDLGIVSASPTQIVASLQNVAGISDLPGDYLLVISKGHNPHATFVVTVGAVGPAGPTGPKGDKGDRGETGPEGLPGATGPSGPSGVPGGDGPAGPTGRSGPSGPQGPAGGIGPQGPAGATGPQGPPGPSGPAGINGLNGAPGPEGPTGKSGPAGAKGLNARGAWSDSDSYALDDVVTARGETSRCVVTTCAVGSAPTPSNPDWELLAAKGADGAAGGQGPQGPSGSTGPSGPSGPAGANGLNGLPGPVGPTGPGGPAGPAPLRTATILTRQAEGVPAFVTLPTPPEYGALQASCMDLDAGDTDIRLQIFDATAASELWISASVLREVGSEGLNAFQWMHERLVAGRRLLTRIILFPDFSRWAYTFTVMRFNTDPQASPTFSSAHISVLLEVLTDGTCRLSTMTTVTQ